MPNYFVGVYWSAREETREECAQRLAVVLTLLSKQAIAPTRWLKKAMSRNAAKRELPTDREGIAPLLRTNKRDVGGEVMRELGFSYSGWAPLEGGASVSFSATVGGFSDWNGNNFTLNFDAESVPKDLPDMLSAAVEAFNPDEGRVGVYGGAVGMTGLDLYSYTKNRGIAKL